MEKVDIVDNDLKVIDTVTKEEAHQKGLLHQTVIAEVIDSNNRWLLVKQASYKQDSGKYVNPMGGHVSAGESSEHALKREVLEELGLKNFDFKLKGKAIFNRKINSKIENHYFIVYEIYSDTQPTLNEESVSFIRLSPDQLKREIKNNSEKFGDGLMFVLHNFYPELLK